MIKNSSLENPPYLRAWFALSGILICLGLLIAAHGWTKNLIGSVALSFLSLAFFIYFSIIIGLI